MSSKSENMIYQLGYFEITIIMTKKAVEEENPQGRKLECVEDYERAARELLSPEVRHYVFSGTESETTLRRNILAFSKFALRRRVLKGIKQVDTSYSYFDGRIKSSLPFFPGCINVTPLYKGAVFDIISISTKFEIPILVSQLAFEDQADIPRLPSLVPEKCSTIWQIYLRENNSDQTFKWISKAKEYGYKALVITVDTERDIKLQNEIEVKIVPTGFLNLTEKDIMKIRRLTSLPLIVKGIMAAEDAELAVTAGADGIVVSNHGGRILDQGQSSLEVLPEIAKHLRSKKRTRSAEVFFDGGIRRGTDILKALALGARGCLLGRALFYGLAVEREKGAIEIMNILREELVRSAALCGVRNLEHVDRSIVRESFVA